MVIETQFNFQESDLGNVPKVFKVTMLSEGVDLVPKSPYVLAEASLGRGSGQDAKHIPILLVA